MYESTSDTYSMSYSGANNQGLIDTYFPPSECFLENFYLTNYSTNSVTNLSNAEFSSSSEMNLTSTSSSELNSSYDSPISQWRSQSNRFTSPAHSDFSNQSINMNLNSSTDYHFSDYKFNMNRSESYQYENSFVSYSEMTEPSTDSSLNDKSYQSSETHTSFELPNSDQIKIRKPSGLVQKRGKRLARMLAREQTITKKKSNNQNFDYLNTYNDPNRPNESIPQLILNALLSTSQFSMQLNEIYSYITHNYEHYAKLDADGTRHWKSQVRYNLTRQDYFVKTNHKNARGHYWSIEPLYLKSILAQKRIENAF